MSAPVISHADVARICWRRYGLLGEPIEDVILLVLEEQLRRPFDPARGAWSTYLFGLVTHAVWTLRRNQTRAKRIVPGGTVLPLKDWQDVPAEPMADEGLLLAQLASVAKDDVDRRILRELVQGTPLRAVADELGISRQAVSSRLQRIRRDARVFIS